MNNPITEKLHQSSEGLLMLSESDYPFEVFVWTDETSETLTNQKILELTGHSQDTFIETVDIDYFFRNCAVEKEWHDEAQRQDVHKFQALIQTLKDNLSDINVYRIGTVNIDVYICGKTPSGDLAGVSTKVVET